MFVSSYASHIQTNVTNTVAKQKLDESYNSTSKVFSTKYLLPDIPKNTQYYPVDYIQQKESSHTRQELEYQKQLLGQNNDESKHVLKNTISKFSSINTMLNAGVAYTINSKMFSHIRVPNSVIHSTKSLDETLPKEPKEIKELHMRHKMVNTYLQNDRFYQLTA